MEAFILKYSDELDGLSMSYKKRVFIRHSKKTHELILMNIKKIHIMAEKCKLNDKLKKRSIQGFKNKQKQPTVKPVIQPIIQPTVIQVKPVKPVIQVKPVKPVIQVIQPTVTQPTIQPTVKPVIQVIQPTVKPVIQPVEPEPTVQPVEDIKRVLRAEKLAMINRRAIKEQRRIDQEFKKQEHQLRMEAYEEAERCRRNDLRIKREQKQLETRERQAEADERKRRQPFFDDRHTKIMRELKLYKSEILDARREAGKRVVEYCNEYLKSEDVLHINMQRINSSILRAIDYEYQQFLQYGIGNYKDNIIAAIYNPYN
jgi:hypothetical protein